MTDEDRDEQIGHKIYHAIEDDREAENYRSEEILSALVSVFTFYMSERCPACRGNIAKTLKKKIPGMLAEANRFAAERQNSANENPCPTHH